jgi:eukaryotic-like serine/threonine-protein kinase
LKSSAGIDTRFHIRRLIGTGSFGVVYEAFDTLRNRTVALKTLSHAAADTVARFKREFRSLAELRHPNLAALYELLVLGEEWALSMELVRGTDLLEHLSFTEIQSAFLDPAENASFDPDERVSFRRRPKKEGKLSANYLQQVRDMFRQLAEAIAFLHANGVVHRDVKPSNVMITPEGRVVLLDFGLAVDSRSDASIDSDLIVGTPGYMSPEQIAQARPAPASDWYSFGVMLYQALTGHRLFPGANAAEIIDQQLRSTPVPATVVLPGLPEDLCALADACLERDPANRPTASRILEVLGSNLVQARGEVRAHERPSTELIGRGREQRMLVRHVTSLASEGGGIVLLHGSPGVGKSVLADRVLDEVRAATGALILGGRCHGWESLPYNAIDAIVDSIARVARLEPSAAVDEAMARSVAMTQLFPTLAFHSTNIGDDETVMLPPTPQRVMALASQELHALLAAMAGDRPIVMFLDDAQWGDYQSAEVFQRLLDAGPRPPIVLILCYSTEDWRTSLLLQGMANTERPKVEIALENLSEPLTEKIVKRAWPDASRPVRMAAVQESAGNPGLLEMILRDGGEPSLERALSAKLEELSTSARSIFTVLLEAAGPLAEEEVERRLELFESDEPLRSLTRARLIRLRRTGGLLELDVYHPRLREVLEAHAHG